MKLINTAEDLFDEMKKMDKDNSVTQFTVAGKGKFTLIYQEDAQTIDEEIESDKELKKMIHESLEAYENGEYQTTTELLKVLSKKELL